MKSHYLFKGLYFFYTMSTTVLAIFLTNTPSYFKMNATTDTDNTFPRDSGIPYVSSDALKEMFHYIAQKDPKLQNIVDSIEVSNAEILLYPVSYDRALFAYITAPRQIRKISEITGCKNLNKLVDELEKTRNFGEGTAIHPVTFGSSKLGYYDKCYLLRNPNMKVLCEWIKNLFAMAYPKCDTLCLKISRSTYFVTNTDFINHMEDLYSILLLPGKNQPHKPMTSHEFLPECTVLVAKISIPNNNVDIFLNAFNDFTIVMKNKVASKGTCVVKMRLIKSEYVQDIDPESIIINYVDPLLKNK